MAGVLLLAGSAAAVSISRTVLEIDAILPDPLNFLKDGLVADCIDQPKCSWQLTELLQR